jgi:hypothetical protein
MALSSCYKSFDPSSFQPAFTVSGFTSSASIEANSLVGYWAFDGSYIDSVSKTAGTGVNTSFTPGFVGQALQGANNGYVISALPNALKGLGSFTIDFWVNTPQNTAQTALLSINDNANFWGALDIFYENGSTATSTPFKIHINDVTNSTGDIWLTSWTLPTPWSSWQNVALTYDQSTAKFVLYQNGTVVGSQTQAGAGAMAFPSTADKIIFGTEQFQCTPSLGTAGGTQGWSGYLMGAMDEVRVYNKALTQTELQALVILQGKGK